MLINEQVARGKRAMTTLKQSWQDLTIGLQLEHSFDAFTQNNSNKKQIQYAKRFVRKPFFNEKFEILHVNEKGYLGVTPVRQ